MVDQCTKETMATVDLSHVLMTGMQVYPGDPEVMITPALTVRDDLVNVLSLHIGSQSGTHLDSPFHVRDDLPTLAECDLSLFIGRFTLVDATGLSPRQAIPHERFTTLTYDARTIVLVRTDWSKHFGTDHYLAHPYPTLESLDFLLANGVRSIALDFLSLDCTCEVAADTRLDNHYLWSEAGGIIAENLTNLRSVTTVTPFISMLPLNLGASDGGPIRAVAFSELT
jgi:arylformamidase